MKGNLNLIISKINFFRENGLYKKLFINLFLFMFIFALNEVYGACIYCNQGNHSSCNLRGYASFNDARYHYLGCCDTVYKFPNTAEEHYFQNANGTIICWKCQYKQTTEAPTPPSSTRKSYNI